ncbi:MAG: hypothetical protein WC023_01600 [Rhodocyclaceae bacterium]
MGVRIGGDSKPKKRVSGEVDGINMVALQSSIHWRGDLRLLQLNESSESMIAEAEWPKKSGKLYWACASTGLLFDKQSGRCLQSSQVLLLPETLAPIKCTRASFDKWRNARVMGEGKALAVKRGPKPKGYVAPEAGGDDD